ncbi:monofunctional biosynthetic peptidoglycan transglycosylase [Phenylobacterium kunshanense]|uniref:Biosynthetic peptidoglycan transglycosylase n=1 Tax=Phenylobacterium kunshanense TaxID=1445034 RepID=A0A328BNM0_9CAUL|nr:monofunctional biosynthetic peptidoglycan transglycosylase [Phenylobacterium kunshanense]RAK67544.1 monofunctional biosynthetic peptidoglycan transglycosylase [Phenylobacterium kunshanense]
MAKRGKGGFWGFVQAVIAAAVIVLFVGPVIMVAVYRFVPPPITFLMVQRLFEGQGLDRRWVPLEKISPTLVRAVIAAEDARFCQHHGFDIEAIEKAMEANARGKKLRGGSTISQQTAKNVFLWPQRDWVRKGLEAWFTVLIEVGWGKERIMEVYLNSIEWGPGVYGAEAAAQRNFKVPASKLTAAQSARLAAILPKPLGWKAAKPGPYVKRRAGSINRNARVVRNEGLTACVL